MENILDLIHFLKTEFSWPWWQRDIVIEARSEGIYIYSLYVEKVTTNQKMLIPSRRWKMQDNQFSHETS